MLMMMIVFNRVDDIMLARIWKASDRYPSKELVIGMAILWPFPFHHDIISSYLSMQSISANREA